MHPHRPRRSALRPFVALVAMGLVLVVGAGPAGADPARPTDYRSEVARVSPPAPGVEVRVVGGDGFLDMEVDRGREVVVLGYQGEPYLRFQADGTVQENLNSPATYLNRSRKGTSPVPQALLGDTLPAPRWETIGHRGQYAWHDHRIHFMGSDPSVVSGLAEGRPVAWKVPFTVDGTRHTAYGSYRLLDAPSPWVWVLLAAALAVALAVAGKGAPVLVGSLAGIVGSACAVGVGIGQNRSIPPGAGATPLTVILPALALVAAIGALVARRRPGGAIALLASAALLGGWVLTRASVLWKAVLPTDLPAGADRAGTAVALGVAVGAAVLVIRSGALAAPRPPGGADASSTAGPTPPGPGEEGAGA